MLLLATLQYFLFYFFRRTLLHHPAVYAQCLWGIIPPIEGMASAQICHVWKSKKQLFLHVWSCHIWLHLSQKVIQSWMYTIGTNCFSKFFLLKKIQTYTNSLVNADLFYVNFTNMTFQKNPIPHLTLTMTKKFPHYYMFYFILYELIPLNLVNTIFSQN